MHAEELNWERLAERFRGARHAAGSTQEQLSQESGLSVERIAELELGSEPTMIEFLRFSRAIGLDPAEAIGEASGEPT